MGIFRGEPWGDGGRSGKGNNGALTVPRLPRLAPSVSLSRGAGATTIVVGGEALEWSTPKRLGVRGEGLKVSVAPTSVASWQVAGVPRVEGCFPCRGVR